MKKENKRVVMNVIQAEVYARNPQILTGASSKRSEEKYYELRERVVGNANIEELVEVPYPITVDSVNSYASSTDYKRDIETAMKMPPRGTNLSDIVDIQKLLTMDSEEARKLVNDLNEKITAGKREK